ncbi:putative ORfan [Saudi moumouvirus]|nr:putative ORfan [Saudi moumouvirus]
MSKKNNFIKESSFSHPFDILMMHLSDEIDIRSSDQYHQTNYLSFIEQLMCHQDQMFMQKIFYNSKK